MQSSGVLLGAEGNCYGDQLKFWSNVLESSFYHLKKGCTLWREINSGFGDFSISIIQTVQMLKDH